MVVDTNKIEKQIRKTLIELISVIIIFIISLFVWFNPNKTITNLIAKNASNKDGISLEQIKALSLNNITPISDNDAINNYDKAILKVTNNQNTTYGYQLIYRISNDSTLDVDCIKFQLKSGDIEKVDFLHNQEIKVSDNYKDYIIYTDEIQPNENKEFSYVIWINEDAKNDIQSKSLKSSFVINSFNSNISYR